MILQITITLLVLILIITVCYLLIKRAKIKKQILEEERAKQESIKKSMGLEKNPKSPKESIIILNKIAREFFREYLKNKHQETYTEIEEGLKKKKEAEMVKFCENMNYLLYSGKEIKKEDSLKMIELFNNIIRKSKTNN
jgi:biopolymer transport protein ExbB/TolQ